ncbi:hypothetical protein [Bifidobacterium cuniculi]|uniref:Uncharacterized protein n=1 Tax=Bifidobacterium cuniculi TaxID=1688 RepID=A0A087APP7_9BIFI|nr:hypothetical protein [Bifidobacterium cuniculi]KFI60747.1 hypothetical protein BCUN_1910 [Bifidobacterium cuniculi]
MATRERLDQYGNPKQPGTHTGLWKAVLVILGYVFTLPVLLTMVDSPADTAVNDWLTRGGNGAVALLVVATIIGWACWIAAFVLSRRPANAGKVGGWRGVVGPAVSVVTMLCAFCTVFALPLLCMAHL